MAIRIKPRINFTSAFTIKMNKMIKELKPEP